MSISTFASGTQSATVSTEHFLSSPNEVGFYIYYVDLVNMVAGDAVELRSYHMVIAGGTQRVVLMETFQGAQPADAVIFWTVIVNDLTDTNAVRFSLKQTLGTSRNFPWSVIKIV